MQSVLTFNNNQWFAASIQCCFGLSEHSSTPISGMKTGDTVSVSIVWIGNNTYSINMWWNGLSTTLKVNSSPGSIYNWAGAVLEPYLTRCDQLPAGPMTFDQIIMLTTKGTYKPIWSYNNIASTCNNKLLATDTKVVITTN